MTAANVVTISRMVLIPVFLVVLLGDWPAWLNLPPAIAVWRPWIAAGVFALLAFTDGVDGYLARSRNEITTFGKFMDPIADKMLITAALLALVELDVLPAWIALVIIAREFIVSGLRMVASAEGRVIAASWYGKWKTVFQIFAIILFIVKDSASLAANVSAEVESFIQASAWTVMGIAVALTVLSMLDYFYGARDVLIGPWMGETAGTGQPLECSPNDESATPAEHESEREVEGASAHHVPGGGEA
ncbi:MAG: CDP-diacylglycerol--glycerol-3-phosphate 3-phosphatidyltransferase [Coriobacteriales bacterium]|nr:CDP-diacylglycerol--glycerol-3-phosphate 3-phosphatidyltransferase [Coriobacteriales bacterium]